MGRPKGFKPSAEQIAAMIEGRKKAREAKLAAGIPLRSSKKSKKNKAVDLTSEKATIYISGKEKDAFDFYTPLRDALRPRMELRLLDRIIKEITDREFWKNPVWVQNKLSHYVNMEIA
jgi:hypothetical protein